MLARCRFGNRCGEEFVSVHCGIGGAIKESVELVEFLLRNRVKFVIVALGAAGGETHPSLRGGGGSFYGITIDPFLIDRPAFPGGGIAAIETCGDQLFRGGIG